MAFQSEGLVIVEGAGYIWTMQNLMDIEREAMKLPEGDRASLASRLLNSLPAVLFDDDDGVAEALRRDAEMDQDTGAAITLDELRGAVAL
jgi:hypothetical protein